ncbi:MAG TPA: cytochrome c [Pyrinomonadaceae bacterium]|jgi:mono/diheme cytochrome c family protein
MKTNLLKLSTIAAFVLAAFALTFFQASPTRVAAREDTAAVYKTKCAMCHSPKAEKLYDPAIAIEDQATAILKGKKGAKPPPMPAFETKGITAEKARALAEYMKSLRAAGGK